MKQLFFLAIFSFFCLGLSAEPLIIGMELSYPPFEMIDKKGEPTGISVDIAKELGDFLKRSIKIENIPFLGLIPSLKKGKIDLIISSLSITPEREKSIAFSEPYIKAGLSLLVGKNSPIQSIEDLKRKNVTIVVKQGTTGEVYARRYLQGTQTLVLDKESSCVLEVVQEKADAFIYDQLSVFIQWKKNPLTTRALLEPFYKESWAIGLRKNDSKLEEQINIFLVEFHKNQGMEKLLDKYLPEEKEAFQKMGIPFFL